MIVNQHFYLDKPDRNCWCFILQGQEIHLFDRHGEYEVPTFKDLINHHIIENYSGDFYCFAKLNGTPCIAITADQRIKKPNVLHQQPIKTSYQILAEDFFKLAALACHLNHWFHTHRFCGRCATKMRNKRGERARICPACDHVVFPRLSPSIIVLVNRGEQLLLARSPHFNPGIYSTLAGFVEPGETVEAAVAREVFEEVGISIKNIKYFGSQPWPFPESLMLAFTAEFSSGELVIDPGEIEAAQWFSPNKLPALPSPLSIARQLIDQHLQRHLDNQLKAS